MHARRISLFSVSSALAVGIMSAPAVAQETSVSSVAEVDEVIVTAQRRPESLIDVPASVQVVTSERLEQANIQSSLDLTKVTPGVSLDPRGPFAQPTIRGVGTQIASVANAANVAVYVDGIYQPSQRANFFELGAIEQIQVLKGPQGTLYGRNATGGAILIDTKDPAFTPTADLSISYGSYEDTVVSAYGTMPLGDTVAVNLLLYGHRDRGYVRNVTTGSWLHNNNDFVGRAKLLWQPVDIASYLVSVDVGYSDQPMAPANGLLNGNTRQKLNNPDLVIGEGFYEVAHSFDPVHKTQHWGVTGRGDLQLENFEIVSHTSYRSIWGRSYIDIDYAPLPASRLEWEQEENTFVQEINVISTWDRPLNYTLGVLFINEEAMYDPYILNGALTALTRTETKSYSAFADVSYDISDRLTVIGGLRYTEEHIDYEGRRAYDGPLVAQRDLKYEALTPRFVVRYELTDDTNIYASYNKGFKSGGNNTQALNNAPPFDPEHITGYEVGIKSRAAPRLSLEGALYYYDYQDIQITAAVRPTSPLPGGYTGNLIYNAAAAEIYGGDLTAIYSVTPELKLNLTAAYTHGRYSDFQNALMSTPIVTGCGAGVEPPCGNTQFIGDATGNTVVRAPEWTASTGFSYDKGIEAGQIHVDGNVFYSSGFFGDAGNRLEQDAYAVLDGNIGFTPAGSPVTISLWGRNLTDTEYVYVMIDSTQYDDYRPAPPRTVGVRLRARF